MSSTLRAECTDDKAAQPSNRVHGAPVQPGTSWHSSTEQSAKDAAWAIYHAKGLRSDNPVQVMGAVLDAYAELHELRTAVMAFAQAHPDSAERIVAFTKMVQAVGR